MPASLPPMSETHMSLESSPRASARVSIPEHVLSSDEAAGIEPPTGPEKGRQRRSTIITIVAVVLFVVGAAYVIFAPKGSGAPGSAGSPPPPAPAGSGSLGPTAQASGSGDPTASATVPGGSGEAMPEGDIPGWHQTFADDFTASGVSANWYNYNGQPGGDPGGYFVSSHVFTQDGNLVISGYKQQTPNGNIYATGGINNSKVFSQTYGLYKVRFRMDKGYGIAYTLMLWPSDDKWPPEIDILEDNGKDRTMTSATLHYGSSDVHVHREVTGDFTVWHTAELEWSKGKLVYRIDGKVWTTMTTSNVPSTPMSIAIQTQAWRCGGSWEGCPNGSTPKVVNLYVDWVVAYTKA